MLSYKYSGDDIIGIQFLFYNVVYTDKIVETPKKFNFNSLNISRDLSIANNNTLNLGYNKVLPLNMNIADYGHRLQVSSVEGYI